MAKKRSPKKMQAVALPKPQPVRVDLDPKVHHLLRQVAAKDNMSMSKFARMMLTNIVVERAEKEGIK